jgi:hypothetical protein
MMDGMQRVMLLIWVIAVVVLLLTYFVYGPGVR